MESMLKLGVAASSHAHKRVESGMMPVLRSLLQWFSGFEETLANKKKLFAATCRQLLCPALQLHGLLCPSPSSCHVGGVPISDIVSGLEGIFKSLFRR